MRALRCVCSKTVAARNNSGRRRCKHSFAHNRKMSAGCRNYPDCCAEYFYVQHIQKNIYPDTPWFSNEAAEQKIVQLNTAAEQKVFRNSGLCNFIVFVGNLCVIPLIILFLMTACRSHRLDS